MSLEKRHDTVLCLCPIKGKWNSEETHLTTAYRSNQDIKDSLSLGDYVVEFWKDFPDVTELYCKSDNAGAIMEIWVNL